VKTLRILFLLCILFASAPLSAQWFIGVKVVGLSLHFKKSPHPQLYKGRIDKHGHLVMNYGIALTAEYRFHPYIGVKFGQAILSDCGGKFAGASMLTLRTQAQLGKFGEGSIGMGPFFYYRKTWKNMDGYVDQGLFKDSGNGRWQTKFVWHGGEVEHNYPINEHMDISTNVLPGIPVLFVVTPGVRWRISN
jgi:hypothetical protein